MLKSYSALIGMIIITIVVISTKATKPFRNQCVQESKLHQEPHVLPATPGAALEDAFRPGGREAVVVFNVFLFYCGLVFGNRSFKKPCIFTCLLLFSFRSLSF